MTNTIFFIVFIPIIAILLLAINFSLAPHNPYQEKDSPFECGYHSFLRQNRTQFAVSFFIFGLLFLLFDLEILLVYPYSVSSYTNDIYGLVIMMIFFVLLTLGFIFELGKNALTIDTRQTKYVKKDIHTKHYVMGVSPTLYRLGMDFEKYINTLPNASQMARYRSRQQLAHYAGELSQKANFLSDRIVAQANYDISQPGVTDQLRAEITSYMVDTVTLSEKATNQLAETVRLAYELVG